MTVRRNAILTERLERLKLNPKAKTAQGELTPVEKIALAPVMLAVRRAMEQFGVPETVRIELSRSEALAIAYAFERIEM